MGSLVSSWLLIWMPSPVVLFCGLFRVREADVNSEKMVTFNILYFHSRSELGLGGGDHANCFVKAEAALLDKCHLYRSSCACIGIVSQGLAKPCISELSVLPQSEAMHWWGGRRTQKDGFPGRDS